jgi:hypothetical protein
MERDKVETSARFPGGVIFALHAMFQERPEEFRGLWIPCPCRLRTANSRSRKRAQNRINGRVVQLEIFFRGSLPVSNIRLVPDFP